MGNAQTNKTKREQTGCGFCSKKRRVLHVSELKTGQHICEPGVNKLTYKEWKHSLKPQYFHHAIIKEIKQRNEYQVTLVLIHYSDVRGLKKGSILIKEEKRDLKYDEMYIVEYMYPKHSAQEIVERATKEARGEEKKVKEAERKAREPESKARDLEKKVKEAERKAREPESKARDLEKKVKEAERKSREPESKARDLEKKVKEAERKAREPESKARDLEKKVKEAERKAREPESKARDLEKKVKEAERKAREPESKARDLEKKVKEAERKSREPETKAKDLEKTVKEAERKSREPETKARDLEKKVKDAERKAKESDVKSQESEKKAEEERKAREANKAEIERNNEDNEKEVSQYAFGNYNLFISNCEHFATWCVLGNKKSFQIDDKWRQYLFPLKISSGVTGILSQLLLLILRLLAPLVTEEYQFVYGASFTLLVIGAFIYLPLLYVRYNQLYQHRHHQQTICLYCYEEKKTVLAVKLMWYIISGALLYFITEACTPRFHAWLVTFVLHVIFTILSLFFRWIYNNLKSPFKCLPFKVKELSRIKKGHVITFGQFGFQHFALVTKVHRDSKELSVISYEGFFFIKLTKYRINWSGKTIFKVRLSKLPIFKLYKADQRISRMKSRIDERKWQLCYNRSDHVCFWASIQIQYWKYYQPVKKNNVDILNQTEHYDEKKNKKKSSLEVERVIVNQKEEIEIGDMVEFSTRSNTSKKGAGIIIEISGTKKRKFALKLVIQTCSYFFWRSVTESEINVDLHTDTIKVHKYHPVHCCSMEERTLRAIYAKECLQQCSKFKLAEFCVLKENNTYQSYMEKKVN